MYRVCIYCHKAYIEEDEEYCQSCHVKTEPDQNEWFELLTIGISYEEIEAYIENSKSVEADWRGAERLSEFIRDSLEKKKTEQ